MRIVIALGGNALLHRGERPDAAVQEANIDRVTTAIAALAHEHEIVITHGNGPQIGLLAVESATDPALSTPYPLDLLGAQTQGMIGSLLARTLHDALPARRIAALVTHTLVRADDPAFDHPTKFVGQVYPYGIAATLARKRGWHIAADTTGWRRVVPSPAPERVLETDTVHELLNSGTLVICAGGGGVPVTADPDTGALTGAEAVIDKDLTAALLAEDLKADFLLILTDVPCVYAGYGTPDQRPVLGATPAELRRGGFPDGSMGPKTEAAARFVERTGGLAAIGSLDAAYEIVHGRSGTLIRPDLTVA
ncbi:carbamate kinase [Streptomyces sp. NBC_01340]|uniref:carbamate kinase n=1 Tax=unclassified Streptomyces TaxID=2593676 RepID=UPI00225098EC|nr:MULTISPECIES: carbamate kinase [unclassified Streptomyces]MCX4594459.1 carbamate kinase [Streptomyces sp. NBC_01549]MCX4597239.1 carbamate kinase [Streptomyces sp. NBC_01549]WSI36288.1 carbamate kinase [Streptomyces sp. NBC_01340]